GRAVVEPRGRRAPARRGFDAERLPARRGGPAPAWSGRAVGNHANGIAALSCRRLGEGRGAVGRGTSGRACAARRRSHTFAGGAWTASPRAIGALSRGGVMDSDGMTSRSTHSEEWSESREPRVRVRPSEGRAPTLSEVIGATARAASEDAPAENVV